MRFCGSFEGLRRAAPALLTLAALWIAPAAGAVSEFSIEEFIGGDSQVDFRIEQVAEGIQLTASVNDAYRGDLRGIYFNVDIDDSLLDGLQITSYAGDPPLQIESVVNVGSGANLRGGGQAMFFDVGVEIGGAGRQDYFDEIVLLITHETLDLDPSIFSEQLFGARTTSPGRKLRGEAPFIVPEPATAGLLALGLTGLAIAGRSRRRA